MVYICQTDGCWPFGGSIRQSGVSDERRIRNAIRRIRLHTRRLLANAECKREGPSAGERQAYLLSSCSKPKRAVLRHDCTQYGHGQKCLCEARTVRLLRTSSTHTQICLRREQVRCGAARVRGLYCVRSEHGCCSASRTRSEYECCLALRTTREPTPTTGDTHHRHRHPPPESCTGDGMKLA
jgi:hypothetical protein